MTPLTPRWVRVYWPIAGYYDALAIHGVVGPRSAGAYDVAPWAAALVRARPDCVALDEACAMLAVVLGRHGARVTEATYVLGGWRAVDELSW